MTSTGAITIPSQFQRDDFLFVPLPSGQKGPNTPGWNLVKNGLKGYDPNLLDHLKAGGNYGYYPAPGSNLLSLDIDLADVFHDAGGQELVEGTYTYSSWEDRHKYRAILECPDIPDCWYGHKTSIKAHDAENTDPAVLEIFFPANNEKTGGQCVGAGSIHPETGRVYQAFDPFAPIKSVMWADIITVCERIRPAALEEHMPKVSHIQGEIKTPGKKLLKDRYRLEIALPDEPYPSGDEIRGLNPWHGSTSKGGNASVNIQKGVLYCFRHEKGYDAAGCDAIRRGIIQCGDNYTSDAFRRHVKELERDFPEVRRREKITWRAQNQKTSIRNLMRGLK